MGPSPPTLAHGSCRPEARCGSRYEAARATTKLLGWACRISAFGVVRRGAPHHGRLFSFHHTGCAIFISESRSTRIARGPTRYACSRSHATHLRIVLCDKPNAAAASWIVSMDGKAVGTCFWLIATEFRTAMDANLFSHIRIRAIWDRSANDFALRGVHQKVR